MLEEQNLAKEADRGSSGTASSYARKNTSGMVSSACRLSKKTSQRDEIYKNSGASGY